MNACTDSCRISALDSLRGIAALVVVIGHTTSLADWRISCSNIFFINNFFDGRSAVTMFFVLSGFVLTVGYLLNGKKLILSSYYIKRIFRIWLPWLVVFAISILAKSLFFYTPPETIPPISDHHASMWSGQNSPISILKQMLFLADEASVKYLPQDWSLKIELKASLIIPFVLLLARKQWFIMVVLTLLIMVFRPDSYCYASFTLGVATAALYVRYRRSSLSSPNACVLPGGLIAFVGLLIYQVRWLSTISESFGNTLVESEIWIVSSIGCSLIIFGVVCSDGLKSFLDHAVLQFLGKVSYSLYLIHVMILICLAPWIIYFLNRLGLTNYSCILCLLILFVLAISLTISYFSEKYIEKTSMNLGNRLSRVSEGAYFLRSWKF